MQRILARHGRTIEGTDDSDAAEPPGEQLALAALCEAAAAGHGLTGDRAGELGEPLLRVVDPARARKPERVGESGGINVHADVAVPARDRPRLERLCRYLCRPIAQERLEETAHGKLRYTLKKPWRDGTIALVLEPLELLARVCALIPPPRFHMVRRLWAAAEAQVFPKSGAAVVARATGLGHRTIREGARSAPERSGANGREPGPRHP